MFSNREVVAVRREGAELRVKSLGLRMEQLFWGLLFSIQEPTFGQEL